MKTIFLLFALFSYSLGQSYMCTVWKDSFLYLTNTTTENTTVEVFSHERNGWIGLAFGSNSSHQSLFMIHYSNKLLFFTVHNDTSKRIEVKGEIDEYYGYKLDNVLHVTFSLPHQFIVQNNFAFFARNIKETPKSDSMIPFHETYGHKILDFQNYTGQYQFGWCSPIYLKMPGRVFSYHLGITIPWFLFILLILVLCIYFRNDQPLRSRGMGPIIMACTSIIPVISEYILAYAIDYETQYYWECFVTAFILFVPIQMDGIIAIVHYFRYILILNMQSHKKKQIEKNVQNLQNWKLKFLTKLSNPVIILLMPLIWIFIYSMICLLIYIIYNFKCGTFAQTLVRFFALGSGFVLFIGIFLLYSWDCIQNFKILIRCNLKRFFLTDDHYYYRLELLPAPIFVILMAIWLFLPIPTLFKMFVAESINLLALWMGCCFVLFITIYKKISQRFFYKKNNELTNDLIEIFLHDELYELFLEFSKNEWSMENVYFKKYCINYSKANIEERKRICQEMRTLFLSFENSTFEINVPKEIVFNAIQKMESNDYSDQLFDELEKENQYLLNDIFGRFRFSFDYQFYLNKMKVIKEM